MRGALHHAKRDRIVQGIIPADAGSTMLNSFIGKFGRDHPRGCGEHWGNMYDVFNQRGSSPRMRGARLKSLVGLPRKGIIPADAGSTRRPRGTC